MPAIFPTPGTLTVGCGVSRLSDSKVQIVPSRGSCMVAMSSLSEMLSNKNIVKRYCIIYQLAALSVIHNKDII